MAGTTSELQSTHAHSLIQSAKFRAAKAELMKVIQEESAQLCFCRPEFCGLN